MPKAVTVTMRGGPKDGATFDLAPAFGLPKVLVFQGLFGPEQVFGIHDYQRTGLREYTWVDVAEED